MNIASRPLAIAIRHALGVAGSVGVALLVTPAAYADGSVANSSPDSSVSTSNTSNENSSAGTAPAADNQADNGDSPPHQLGAVVVTAQRRAEKIQDVPAAVTAVSGGAILAADAGSSAADVLNRYVPDASAASPTPTRPRWWIRGVGTGAQGYDVQSPVGVYFDDVYFSNANATGQPVFDLQRVEVLEGPQGTLWGKNTTGGAINFVSVKPSFDNSGYAKVDQSSHDDQLYEAAYGGGINDWLAARASFHSESADSPFKNAADGSESQFHDDAGRVQFLAKLAPDLTALLNVHFRDYYTTGSVSSAVGTGPNGLFYQNGVTDVYASGDPYTAVGTPVNTTEVRQDGLALTITDQFERNTLTSITGFEGFQTQAFTNGPTYYSATTALNQGDSLSNGDTHQLSEELRLASPRTDRDNWVIGTMLFTEDINSYGVSATLPSVATGGLTSLNPPSWALSSLTQNTRSYSFFGSNTFNFTPRFDLTTGLRYTDEDKSDDYVRVGASGSNPFSDPSAWWLNSSVSAPVSVKAQQDASKAWGAWTWDATPEYKLSDNVRSYVRIAHGFRSGGFNTSALTQAAVNANGGVVNPEYLTSYEAGLKSEWLDGQLIANGDVFYYDYDDIQVNVVQNVPNGLGGTTSTSVLTNAAKGRANGVELNLEALPVENLHLSLGADWLDTKYLDYTTGTPGVTSGSAAFQDFSGNHFVRSPHLSDVFAADYRLPQANGGAVVLATDWKYQSKQFYYGNDQVDAVYAQSGYTIGNARISYEKSKVTYTAYVDNLTDKLYKIHSGTVSTSYYNGNSNTVNWSPGRIVGASLTVKF